MIKKTSIEPIGGRSFKEIPCYTTETMNLIALGVTTDEGRNFILNYAQFLYAEHSANLATEGNQDAAPEQLRVCFTIGEVVVLGNGLHMLAKAVQKAQLQSIAPSNRNYPTDSPVTVYSVAVTIHENGEHS